MTMMCRIPISNRDTQALLVLLQHVTVAEYNCQRVW